MREQQAEHNGVLIAVNGLSLLDSLSAPLLATPARRSLFRVALPGVLLAVPLCGPNPGSTFSCIFGDYDETAEGRAHEMYFLLHPRELV